MQTSAATASEPRPEDAARAMRHRPGFVFLDSALEDETSVSILASDPDLVLSGGPEVWPALEAAIASRSRPGADLGIPDGAAIGWLGFDGSLRFGFYDQLHIYSHRESRWITPPPASHSTSPLQPPPRIPFKPDTSQADFLSTVRIAREYIAAGDIYQVCLSHRFSAPFSADPFPFYENLRTLSPAPFSAFLHLEDTVVTSSSPELFLRISGRQITTCPIKGTRPRSPDPIRDERSAYDLMTSPKEIAELVMITDLERNDLGRICQFGSIRVPSLLRLERFQQVHHLVSTISGTLLPEISHPTALRLCSPGGSISGAPKKRALEIIHELEPHTRGLYTGALGYFGYNGESRFSILIRTAIFHDSLATFHVGAGIVADSVPEKEWQETLDKASGLLAAARASVTIL